MLNVNMTVVNYSCDIVTMHLALLDHMVHA